MVDISPQGQFLMALNNAFQAARSNAPQGNLGAGIPGVAGGSEDGPGSPGGGAPAGVSIGGGVPGTALTGTGVANALIGGAPAASAEFQQVLNSAQGFQAGDRDRPGGSDVTTGNPDFLKAMMLGPLAPLAMLSMIVNSAEAGERFDSPFPGGEFPGTGTLFQDTATGERGFTPAISSPLGAGTPNTIRQGPIPGGDTFERTTGPTVSRFHQGPTPSLNALNRDRPETQSGSGASPNRGTGLSNAGR